jgi:hypothetical protein
MISLLSLLFSFCVAGLIYGLSLLPTASLVQTEDAEEVVSQIDWEPGKIVAPNTCSPQCRSQDRENDAS